MKKKKKSPNTHPKNREYLKEYRERQIALGRKNRALYLTDAEYLEMKRHLATLRGEIDENTLDLC